MAESDDLQALLIQSDKLYEANKFREAFDILNKFADSEDPEVLWRLLRVYYRMGTQEAASTEEAIRLAETAMAFREKVLVFGKEHMYCQKVSYCVINDVSIFGYTGVAQLSSNCDSF